MLKAHQLDYNDQGNLLFGRVDTVTLAKKYGTPLFVYDVEKIRNNAQAFLKAFKSLNVKARVAYASKAFSTIAMAQVAHEESLYLDVVSKGELYTALQANFPTEKIHFHGNNKSYEEIDMAIKNNIGCIVIDNFYEIELLEQVLEERHAKIDALIRISPGVSVDTHHYVQTGDEDSKFGFHLKSSQADIAFKKLHNHPRIRFIGVHCHIGSQIFQTNHYIQALRIVMEKINEWKKETNYVPSVLNIGGGFGIRYTKDDKPLHPSRYIKDIVYHVKQMSLKINIPLPEIWIEPGRSIVGDAGITLYTVGSMKNIPNVRKYISVDGGMTDNLRPALYNASYEGIIANKANKPLTEVVSIAGKCCESGDMLVYDLPVAQVESGDIIALFSTGAYGYSMANHYNRFSKPAVVFLENEKDYLVVRRENYEDVVKNDLHFKDKKE